MTYAKLEERAWELLRQHAEIYLESQAARLRASGLDVGVEVRIGIPREQIAQAATREPDTLIAMATHGYGGLRRWALGSVADKVRHAGTTPTLLVRDRSSDD